MTRYRTLFYLLLVLVALGATACSSPAAPITATPLPEAPPATATTEMPPPTAEATEAAVVETPETVASPTVEAAIATPSGSTGAQLIRGEGALLTPDISEETLAGVVADHNQFGVELFQQSIQGNDSNILISPNSIYTAFAMLLPGTDGATRDQLIETFHFNTPPADLAAALNSLNQTMYCDRGPENLFCDIFTSANAFWLDDLWTTDPAFIGQINPDYLNYLSQNYDAGLYSVDMQGDEAVPEINRWISDATQGELTEVLQDLPPNATFVLANAVYFNGAWYRYFSPYETQSAPFTQLDGTEGSAEFMYHAPTYFSYSESDAWQSIRLPYNGDSSMVVILPREGRYAEVEQSLTGEALANILAATPADTETSYVELYLPKFKYDSDHNLINLLSEMGVVDLFDADLANLSGITTAAPLYIADAQHNATITTDETGTTAAAATVLVGGMGAGPGPTPPPIIEFRADRPFIYVIQSETTGVIQFMGRIAAP